ncbi:LLM class flavin-dependent oxidoreductase [Plantactinospora mayteni]|uniref:LLM class flavin-dependent oxidoreductase n=1 Tax=Plantactinospora mayteni TaxID=566021 RepID=UPI0019428F2A|nr:LLM class flavin-dependent oxidoreductase [Plantactinospora mayteni]
MLELYATSPRADEPSPTHYRERALEVARWAEASACRGLLIFTDHHAGDPWALGQFLLERTERLVPLVAAQPVYMHPFTAARLVSTMSFLYGRPVDLNLVTGGHPDHLRALGCRLDHDERYDQLVEYGRIITALLVDQEPMSHAGRHYDMPEALLRPALPADLMPRIFVAGASEACHRAARELGVVRLTYPRALSEYEPGSSALAGAGIRVGIIARDTGEEAWRVAHERCPKDPVAERLARIASRSTDSHWYRRLQADAETRLSTDDCYWLYPLRSGREYCPYLVGSHAEVARTFARYLDMGITTLILQAPRAEADIRNAEIAVRLAESLRSVATPAGGPAAESVPVGSTDGR